MSRTKHTKHAEGTATPGKPRNGEHAEAPSIKVTDRRHWAREKTEGQEQEDETVSTQPTIVDQYRQRAEAAEQKLHEYIAAFKQAQAEQEAFRVRLARDVDRKVELRFGELIGELLQTVDDLELAAAHANDVPEARALADGVILARDRFLSALQRHGVERIEPHGEEFDPQAAEALRVDPVDDPDQDGKITETLRPGYRLGELVVRAAQVAVGRLSS